MNLPSSDATCKYFACAMLLLGGVAFTLMALAALHAGADIRNAHASATAPLAWGSFNVAAQLPHSGEMPQD